MSTKPKVNDDNTVNVEWSSEPLDVTLTRKGTEKPERKVKVRGILREDWLEKRAGLPEGSVRKLLDTIIFVLEHGYEPRLCESIRFVHMVDASFRKMRVSVQPMNDFQYCIKNVPFRLQYDGAEVSAGEAETMRECACAEGEDCVEVSEVTPDIMVRCEVCGHMNRAGKRAR